MPLPPEELEDIKHRIEMIRSSIASIRDVISDLRAAGLPTAEREAEIKPLEDALKQWQTFYSLQMKRTAG